MSYSKPGKGRKTVVMRVTDAQHEAYRIMAKEQCFPSVSAFIRFTLASLAQSSPAAREVLIGKRAVRGLLADDGRLLRRSTP